MEIHQLLKRYRVSENREFFKLSLSDALVTAMPVVKKFLFDTEKSPDNLKPPSCTPALTDSEISILEFLAGDWRKYGYLTLAVQNEFYGIDKLEIEYYLACLKEHGFVDEKNDRENNDKNWKITSKGIKYLFDTGIIKINR